MPTVVFFMCVCPLLMFANLKRTWNVCKFDFSFVCFEDFVTFAATAAQCDTGMHTGTLRMNAGRCQALMSTHASAYTHTRAHTQAPSSTKLTMRHCWVALLCSCRERHNRVEKLQVAGLDQVVWCLPPVCVCVGVCVSPHTGFKLLKRCSWWRNILFK